MSGSSSGGVRCGSRANRTELQGWTSDHGLVARRPQTMKQKLRARVNRKKAKTALRLPDLEHAKAAVLNSLTSADSQRGYRHAIDEFVDWYCSEPRLAFNRIVVLRYRSYLESRSTGSRNGQPPPGRCAAARVRSCRLRPAQFGSRGWHSPRQRGEETGGSPWEPVDGRAGSISFASAW